MANRFRCQVQMAITLILCVMTLLIASNYSSRLQKVRNQSPFAGQLVTDSIQLQNKFSINETFPCFETSIAGIEHIKICTFTEAEDATVSADFIHGRYFHERDVARMIGLLRRHPEATFVDLGANIGSFTLPAARLTNVVAVEPFRRTMARLARSVQLGGVGGNVSLVNNAVSSYRTSFAMRLIGRNPGANFLKKFAQIELPCVNASDPNCVHTIILDDLLPLVRNNKIIMKVDVEAHESEVFQDFTAGRFFLELDVQFIFMEWVNVKNRPKADVEAMLSFFASRSYVTLNPAGNSTLFHPYNIWPDDVIFVKQQYIKSHAF